MNARQFVTGTAIAIAAAGATAWPVLAQAQAIKPGLWEMTQKVGSNPQVDAAMAQMQQQMASMPPAQRKQMEDMMAKQGVQVGGNGGMSVKVCLTPEMVAQNAGMAPPSSTPGDCRTSLQPRVGNLMKMTFTCAQPPTRGEGEYTFNGTDAFSSKMTIYSSPRGKEEKMVVEGSARFLGADCGSVRPHTMPPAAKK